MAYNMTENLNWVSLGALSEATSEFSDYSRDIGVYRAILNGKVVYIGKATELSNGGFRKRLRDICLEFFEFSFEKMFVVNWLSFTMLGMYN